ncbi:MAG: sulfate adenylyltransferase [Thaumarchaeota archaeon]|nr:sulfate adenylyltransferase [Nitrososphaerota archaeon]MCL5318094.1 sulfate adenylyltransferase [Nitrososphaerota archaeon]
MVSRVHGGKLVNQVAASNRRKALLKEVDELPKVELNYESAVDVESIAYGVYSPLEGFMNGEEYRSVLDEMRLPNDLPWTIPIVLDASKDSVKDVKPGDTVALSAPGNVSIAAMHIEDIYSYDKREYSEKVFRTADPKHPGVAKVHQLKEVLLGGQIEVFKDVENPFERYTLSPAETRVLFKEKGWKTIVGFQTRNAPHIGHEYIQKSALAFIDGVFVNPVIGRKKQGDFKDEVIVEAYRSLIDNYYQKDTAVMSILRYEMKYAGPREAILHAIIRKNFGCTHFAVGRDHAGVGNYYGPYDAQEIFKEFPDLGVTPVFFREFYYCKKCVAIVNERICPHTGEDRVGFSGTKMRDMIVQGLRPPSEIMRPEVADAILKFKNPFVE